MYIYTFGKKQHLVKLIIMVWWIPCSPASISFQDGVGWLSFELVSQQFIHVALFRLSVPFMLFYVYFTVGFCLLFKTVLVCLWKYFLNSEILIPCCGLLLNNRVQWFLKVTLRHVYLDWKKISKVILEKVVSDISRRFLLYSFFSSRSLWHKKKSGILS